MAYRVLEYSRRSDRVLADHCNTLCCFGFRPLWSCMAWSDGTVRSLDAAKSVVDLFVWIAKFHGLDRRDHCMCDSSN